MLIKRISLNFHLDNWKGGKDTKKVEHVVNVPTGKPGTNRLIKTLIRRYVSAFLAKHPSTVSVYVSAQIEADDGATKWTSLMKSTPVETIVRTEKPETKSKGKTKSRRKKK